MRPALFTITCATCHVRLAVRSAEAVGAILECPKCGCMVPVTPPEGWQPPKPPEIPAAQSQQSPLPLGQTQLQQSPLPLGESQGESIAGQDTVTSDASAVGGKGTLFRGWHSWYMIAAATTTVAIVGVVLWLTIFSRSGSNNQIAPIVTQSENASIAATVGSDQKDVDQPSPEQLAAIDKNDKNESTPATSSNPNDKPDTKPAAENATDVKPQPDSTTPEDKTPDAKGPRQNAPEVKPPEAKPSTDEKNNPSETTSPQNKESVTPATGTSKLVKLVAAEEIDAQSRLAEVIPSIEIREMPFARAIGLAASISGLPITIDPDVIARLGVSLRDPITIRLSGATMEEVLQAIVARRGMAFVAEDGQILVTSPAEHREKLRRVRYTVSDLTDSDKASIDQLALLVQKLVAPESWRAAGGEGAIETEKTALAVTQTGAVHDQILVFCEKLRNARALPLKSNRDPKLFDLTTRLQQASSALNRPVTANFHEPGTLVDILAYLGQQAEVDILVDRQALGEAGWSDKSEISFTVDNRPLATALDDLLNPLKLSYRVIDAHTLQVSTQSALDARLELEFYPVGKILGKNHSGSELIERIKTAVSPSLWDNANSSAAIYFDPPSATLIVLQSPPVQAAIQVFLNITMEKQK